MPACQDLTFVIADDHPMVRETVGTILKEKGFQVLGEASDGDEAVRLCQDLKPRIAVLDISMPRLTGIEAARRIKRNRPNIKIIILTAHSEVPHLLESLVVGVSGFVTKSKAASGLLDAIDAVCKGEVYVRAASGIEMT